MEEVLQIFIAFVPRKMKPLWRTTERKECCYSMYSRKVSAVASGNKGCIRPAKIKLISGNRFLQYFIDGLNLLCLSCNISTLLKKCNYRVHALSRYLKLHKSDSARSYWRACVWFLILMTHTISPETCNPRTSITSFFTHPAENKPLVCLASAE